MKKKLLLYIFYSVFLCFLSFSSAGQHSTRNNYTGNYEDFFSWDPWWVLPQVSVSYDITINGYIKRHGFLSFTGSSANLIVNDTLVIYGDLYLGDKNDIFINDNAILIIFGDLHLDKHSEVNANGCFIVTGNILKAGPDGDGSFKSNDDPVKVFIGGTVPDGLTDDNHRFSALNCTQHPTIAYENSTCSYGNMVDLMDDAYYVFYQSLCPNSAPASITANGPTTFCDGGQVVLISSEGLAYEWSNGKKTREIAVVSPGNYTVRAFNSIGCPSDPSIPQMVTINPKPPKPTIQTIGSSSICQGDSTRLSSPESPSYLWSNGSTSRTISVKTAEIYTLQVINEFGCMSESSEAKHIVIHPLPPAPAIELNGPSGFCIGDSVILTAPAYSSWLWSTGEVSRSITIKTKGNYSVKVIDQNNCMSHASGAVGIQVNPSPEKPVIEADGPLSFCEGEKVRLTATEGTSYSWSNGESIRKINVTKTGFYSVRTTNQHACMSPLSDAVEVVVNPIPDAVLSPGPALSICEGEAVTLRASGGTNYKWSNGSSEDTIRVEEEGMYEVEVFNEWDCSSTAESEVRLLPLPVSNAGEKQLLNFIFETRMDAGLSIGETGEWSVVSGKGHFYDLHSPTSRIVQLSLGENKFLWKVSNGNCYDESEVVIEVSDLFIPDVITPNDDGKNDRFVLDYTPENTELIIFDRFGNVRFHDRSYQNTWSGFDEGRTQLPEDTYFFVLKFPNGMIKKGSIMIKR